MKLIKVRCKDTEKQTIKEALEVINLITSSKTQEEAMKRLKALLGNNVKMNMGCWSAYKKLPKKAGN